MKTKEAGEGIDGRSSREDGVTFLFPPWPPPSFVYHIVDADEYYPVFAYFSHKQVVQTQRHRSPSVSFRSHIMDLVSNSRRGSSGLEDRRGSAGYGQQFSPPMSTSMSMGAATSSAPNRAIASSQTQTSFASMTGAGFALQEGEHPSSKSATGGQSHGHRPVSAMPTTTSRSQNSSSRQADSSVLNTIDNTAYNDRRASAHPTLSSASSQSTSMAPPPLPTSPSGSLLDSTAINNGIPITSPSALQYFAAHPRRQQVHFGNYLLLQTLGEGEFGKVKLGVHKEWGEEVAVKLIKRDKVGTPDGHLQINGPSRDPSKMSKVEKEIRVLKVGVFCCDEG
jgi:protein-serine/threonine kinase